MTAKKGARRCRVDPAVALHTQVVTNELKRAVRFLASRFARLPLHREEPPPARNRKRFGARGSGVELGVRGDPTPEVALAPNVVETQHSLVRYGTGGWVCASCRKFAASDAAALKLARTNCISVLWDVEDPSVGPPTDAPIDNAGGFQQRIHLMDLHFEKELVIQEVLSDSQPLPAPPPEPPPCTPMCTARWAPVGSPSPFFWMSGETFVHTDKDSVAVIAEGSDSGLSDFSNFWNCGACFSDAELEPPSPCVSIAADACDSQNDGDTVSPVPEGIVARQGPKRRRVEPPVAAVRGEALLMRMAAAERAVNQMRGAIRDRKSRTRMPPHSGSRRPRQGPAKPRLFFSTPQKCGSSGTTCGSRRARSVIF